jgi:hypothetical protein
MHKSPDTIDFEKLSKQRIDFTDLGGGGQRARLTLTLPNGQQMVYVEEITPADVQKYATHIAGCEIGFALADGSVGYDGAEIGNIFKDIGKALGKGVKAIGKVAKKVVTSKVMQAAAKGLAMVAPALGPMAAPALAISGGIGVAGKLLASKTAQEVGAPRTAIALANGAVADAKRITKSPSALGSILRIANDKANAAKALGNVFGTSMAAKKPPLAGDMLALARAGRVRSNRGGAVTPAQLQAAHNAGRVFFVAA